MPNIPVTFSGDASGVAAAAAMAQAAIDSVHGKSVTVEVNVRTNGARDAATALDQHAAASGRAAAGARDHASASERASSSLRDHASASDRASSATRDHGLASRDASRNLERHATASSDASREVAGLGDSHRYSGGEVDKHTRAMVSGRIATVDFGRSVSGLLGLNKNAADSHRYSGSEVQKLTRSMVSGGLATADFARSTSGMVGVNEKAADSHRFSGSEAEKATRALVSGGLASADFARSATGMVGVNDKAADSHRYSGSEVQKLTRAMVGGGLASADFARSVSGMLDFGQKAGGVGDGASSLARGLNSLGEASSLGNVMGKASSGVSMLGLAAVYSAAGSGILTAAVGALGVAGVGALTGVGVAAGLAGGAMASFAVNAHQDSARFGNTMKQMGTQAHLGAQMISEPMAEAVVGLGRSLVTADGHMTQAGMGIANSLKDGFGTAASVINDSSSDIVRSGALAAGGFARLTAEAAPGMRAFLGEMPSLTAGAVSGMSQITQEFGRSAGAIEGATPALNRMMGAAGGLGAELVSIGARSVVPFAEDMTSMTQATTRMANQLEPAIKPSMSAFSDLFGAAAGGIGGLSPGISGFAETVSRNSPQIRSEVDSIGRGMLALGSAAVDGLGQAAPSIAGFADSLQQNQGGIASLIGDTVSGLADAGAFASNTAGGVTSFNSLGAKLSDATGGPIAKPGSLNGSAIEHNIGSYLNPVGAFKEAFGIGQPGGGWAPPPAPAPGVGPAPGGAPQAQPVSRAGVGAAPAAAAAPHAFIGPVAPMPDATAGLFTGAAAGQHAAAGSVGSAMQSVIRKTVSQNIPAAEAGGAAIGGAMAGGTATGVTSTQTVTDTVMRKHIKHMIDVGQQEGDIHSPSRKTRRMLGQPLGEGTALGVQDTAGMNKSAAGGLIGHYSNENIPAPVINIRGGKRPAKMAQDAAAPGAEGGMIRGQAKQAAFGEDANAVGSKGDAARAVFDKQVMSWDAKPGVDITQIHDMGELNAAIQSPLSGRQYAAMNSMQGILDQPGLTRNSQMFGERTEQNIMRNRSGAFDVAGQWADHLADQKDQAKEVGKGSADGYTQGVNSGLPEAFGAGQNMAEQGHAGYKKKDQQNSPSAVWAGMGGNSVAGIPIGFAAGVPAAVTAMSNSAGTMADVVGGYLSDRGLMAGYAWAENVETGASSQIKKADYKALGLPQLGAAAKAGLAATGLLSAGSGASSYKTPGNTPGVVVLAPASPSSSANQNITITHNLVHDDGHISQVATQVTLDMFGKVTEAIPLQPSN